MDRWLTLGLSFGLAYLLGSIPFGLILSKLAGKGDIRNIGSGNIGATNVLRTGSKGLAAGVLLLDIAKGYLAMWVAWTWFPYAVPMAAIGAVLGHCFPIWLGFKGGKGVATNAGVSFGVAWPVGLAYAAVWLAVLAGFRFSSLAGMAAVCAAAIAAAVMGLTPFIPVMAGIAVLVIFLHRENLGRLAKGTEPKIGKSKPDNSE